LDGFPSYKSWGDVYSKQVYTMQVDCDVTYLVKIWIYCPFKGASDLMLEEYKANCNFIQSLTQMFVQ